MFSILFSINIVSVSFGFFNCAWSKCVQRPTLSKFWFVKLPQNISKLNNHFFQGQTLTFMFCIRGKHSRQNQLISWLISKVMIAYPLFYSQDFKRCWNWISILITPLWNLFKPVLGTIPLCGLNKKHCPVPDSFNCSLAHCCWHFLTQHLWPKINKF